MAEDVRTLKSALDEKKIATELTKLSDVEGKEIVINYLDKQVSRFGETTVIYGTLNGKPIKILMTAIAIVTTLSKITDMLPLKCTIVKDGRYYRFK